MGINFIIGDTTMSDDNNNDDDIEGKKLNPSFHDLINSPEMNGPVNNKNLNPTLEDAIIKITRPLQLKLKGVMIQILPGESRNNFQIILVKIICGQDIMLYVLSRLFSDICFIVGIAGIGFQ